MPTRDDEARHVGRFDPGWCNIVEWFEDGDGADDMTGTFTFPVTPVFEGDHYTYGPYLSPFYSPELFGDSPHAWFGPKPAAWPAWLPFSPALLILPFPGLFRFTCYYYRGAYYKAFWADPPSCAVGEPRTRYRGEHSFPLILQNAHRFFMWVALVFIAFLVYDVWLALWFTNPVSGASESCIAFTEPLLVCVVSVAHSAEASAPKRTSLPSISAGPSFRPSFFIRKFFLIRSSSSGSLAATVCASLS